MRVEALVGREPRRCPECDEALEDGYCDLCGYDVDDQDDAEFDRDELGDDPEED